MGYYCKNCSSRFSVSKFGTLECECRSVPVVRGIARFVGSSNYADAFGDQWNRFFDVQLDSVSGLSLSSDRLKRILATDSLEWLKGKRVLEIGCGAGRFTEILLSYGATVCSIDLSNAVEANVRNFGLGSGRIVAQADGCDLPFSDDSFDLAICLGVLQHTSDSETVLKEMKRVVASGGIIGVDHYRLTLSFCTRMLPFYRWFLKFFTPKDSISFSEALVKFFFPIHLRLGRNLILYALLSRVSPIVTYMHSYPTLSDSHQLEWSIMDTHDSLFDYHKRLHTVFSFRRMLKRVGMTPSRLKRGGIGIECRVDL